MTKSDTWLLKQCITGRCVDVLLLPATDTDEKRMVQPGEHFAKLNRRIEILNSVTHLLLRLSEVTLVSYSAHSLYYGKKRQTSNLSDKGHTHTHTPPCPTHTQQLFSAH